MRKQTLTFRIEPVNQGWDAKLHVILDGQTVAYVQVSSAEIEKRAAQFAEAAQMLRELRKA